MDIDVLYKVLGYACLYKSYGKGVDSRPVKDITTSLVREAKPEKLFKYFAANQIEVTNPYPGIYYLLEGFLFPVQIIVTKELESDVHIVLKALTRELKKEHLWRLLEYAKRLQEKFDHHLMDSVLEVSIRANESLIRESKGDVHMYQALLEIMEPEIKEIVERAEKRSAERGEKRGEEAGIKNLILTLCELGMNRADTKDIVSKRYPLSEEELNQYLAEFF